MRAAHPPVSFADLERWPEDGRRYELYDGEVFEIPAPFPLHQIVLGRLYVALASWVREHGGLVLMAPLDIVLTGYDCVQPDIVWFAPERRHLVRPRVVTRAAPDLAIEILSDDTARNDRGRKKSLLARHGTREYWLVEPERERIELHRLEGDAFVLHRTAIGAERIVSLLLPAFVVSPRDVIGDEASCT